MKTQTVNNFRDAASILLGKYVRFPEQTMRIGDAIYVLEGYVDSVSQLDGYYETDPKDVIINIQTPSLYSVDHNGNFVEQSAGWRGLSIREPFQVVKPGYPIKLDRS